MCSVMSVYRVALNVLIFSFISYCVDIVNADHIIYLEILYFPHFVSMILKKWYVAINGSYSRFFIHIWNDFIEVGGVIKRHL